MLIWVEVGTLAPKKRLTILYIVTARTKMELAYACIWVCLATKIAARRAETKEKLTSLRTSISC